MGGGLAVAQAAGMSTVPSLPARRRPSAGPTVAERRGIALAAIAALLLVVGLTVRRAEAAGSGVLDPRLAGLLVDLVPLFTALVAVGLAVALLARRAQDGRGR